MNQNTNDILQEKSGTVIELLPNATFRIQLDEGEKEVIAYVSGKMRKNRIRVLLGDKVRVAFSSYDLQRGRITYRSK